MISPPLKKGADVFFTSGDLDLTMKNLPAALRAPTLFKKEGDHLQIFIPLKDILIN